MRGGTAGAVAMFCNVGALMWMRTTINYQVRLVWFDYCVQNVTRWRCANVAPANFDNG
jgi:hypothetical protein